MARAGGGGVKGHLSVLISDSEKFKKNSLQHFDRQNTSTVRSSFSETSELPEFLQTGSNIHLRS